VECARFFDFAGAMRAEASERGVRGLHVLRKSEIEFRRVLVPCSFYPRVQLFTASLHFSDIAGRQSRLHIMVSNAAPLFFDDLLLLTLQIMRQK
jgi:hypothetical protein